MRCCCATSGGATSGNRKGYAGYELDPVLAYSMWHVRHRVLNSDLGRWTRRDPLGYLNKSSVYAYATDNPLARLDASGPACSPVLILESGGPEYDVYDGSFGVWWYTALGGIYSLTSSGAYRLEITNRGYNSGAIGDAFASGWVWRWYYLYSTDLVKTAHVRVQGSVICDEINGCCHAIAGGGAHADTEHYFSAAVTITASANGPYATLIVTTVAAFYAEGVTSGGISIKPFGIGGGVSVDAPGHTKMIQSTREYKYKCVKE